MLPIKQWFDIDAAAKDGDYANRIIRWIRMQMQPLVSVDAAELGMSYMLARQNMGFIEDLFQNPAKLNLNNRPVSKIIASGYLDDPNGDKRSRGDIQDEMMNVKFVPLPIWEKIKNILIAEIKKMGVVVDCRATDPTSSTSRAADENFIRKKKDIEGLLSYVYASIGQKPVQMSEYKNRFGEKHDNGNTKDFEAMGLSQDNPDDVAFFMKNFHKLDWELAQQKVIDAVMGYNEVQTEKFDKWAVDIMSKKAISAQLYVSNENGGLIYDYATPETTYIYGGGRRKDYNDANAKCIQNLITIKEFLDRVGNAFDYESHIDKIMLAVFTASAGAIDITGINPDYGGIGGGQGGDWYCRSKDNLTYTRSQFLQFKVLFGYMEWISQEETDYGKTLSSTKGKKFDNRKAKAKKGMENQGSFFEDNQNPDGKRYQTKARYETPTYKAYYLGVTAIDHIMFDFGKMTYQDIQGYNDASSNFSILTYKEIGDPLTILGIQYVDLINECWFKWKYEVRRSKPRGTDYNYDTLMAMAEDLFQDTEMSESEKFDKIISWYDRSANRVWKFPIGPNGEPIIMNSSQLNISVENGLSPEIMRYWEIMANAYDRLIDLVMGSADLRQGDSTRERSSMNNEFKALEYSQNSTYYLPDMVTFMCRALAVRTGMLVQDIVLFKDYDTLAYKWLEMLVGDETLEQIESMGKIAMHRYGIYVESLNQSAKMMKLSTRIDFALQNGKITNAQALLVEEIKSPTVAYQTLAYFEQRQERNRQQQAMQLQKQQTDAQMSIEKEKQRTEIIKGDYGVQIETIRSKAAVSGHLINQEGGIAKTQIKGAIDSQQIAEQATADLKLQQANVNATGQVSPPPPTPAGGGPAGGPAPAAPAPQSGIRTLIDQAQAGPAVQQ